MGRAALFKLHVEDFRALRINMKAKLMSIAALGTASALATSTMHAQDQDKPLAGLKEGFTYDWVEKWGIRLAPPTTIYWV